MFTGIVEETGSIQSFAETDQAWRLFYNVFDPLVVQDVETGDFLIQLATHLAYHLGQLSYHRRVVSGDSRGVGALASSELASARPIAPSTDA